MAYVAGMTAGHRPLTGIFKIEFISSKRVFFHRHHELAFRVMNQALNRSMANESADKLLAFFFGYSNRVRCGNSINLRLRLRAKPPVVLLSFFAGTESDCAYHRLATNQQVIRKQQIVNLILYVNTCLIMSQNYLNNWLFLQRHNYFSVKLFT